MSKIHARVKEQDELRIRSSVTVTRNLNDLADINVSNLQDGSVLVYKESNENWVATRNLNQQNVDGGEF
jgi:hypothetical protein